MPISSAFSRMIAVGFVIRFVNNLFWTVHWKQTVMSSDNGLAPNRWKPIVSTKVKDDHDEPASEMSTGHT